MSGLGELHNLLAVCREAASSAGDYAVRHRPRSTEIHERFSHDVKLRLDHECQAEVTSIIHRHFPEACIIGEEGSSGKAGPEELEWIVDPIDGTVNYFHGLGWWCSSVAVRRGGAVLAGTVYAPEVNMLFDAVAGGDARLNERPIRVSPGRLLAESLVVTGSEKELEPGRPPLATAQCLAPHVQKIRILGAAALDLCQVAAGSVDVFFQNGLYVWDVAAAGLVIERAGGAYRQTESTVSGRYRILAASSEELARQVGHVMTSR